MREIIDAGQYSDEDVENPETEAPDWRKLKIQCPVCKRKFAAMLSKFTKAVRSGWRWVCDSHKEPYSEYETKCNKCGSELRFVIYTPQ